MTDFLTSIAGVSLGGGAVILLLVVLAKLTRGRYGARWRCWAWLLLALRLAVPLPLLPAGSASAPIQIQVPPDRVIYQPMRTPRPSAAQPSQPVQTAVPSAAPSSVPVSTPAPEVLPTEQTQPAPITVGGILLALWVTGGAAVLGWNLIAHFRFKRYLARWCRPAEDAVHFGFSPPGPLPGPVSDIPRPGGGAQAVVGVKIVCHGNARSFSL